MRRLQRLSIAAVLTLMLATAALAGIMETPPGTIDTPPEPQAASVTSTGITDTPPSNQQNSASSSESVATVALNLLQSVLSVF